MVKIFSLLFLFSFFAEGVSRIRLKGSGASLIMDQGAASQLEVTTMLFATINASFASMDTRLAALEGSKKNLFVVLFTRFINRLKGASSPPLRLSAETTAGTTAGAVELSALFDLPGPVHHFLFKASVSNAYNGRTDWMLLVNGVEVDRSEYENTYGDGATNRYTTAMAHSGSYVGSTSVEVKTSGRIVDYISPGKLLVW